MLRSCSGERAPDDGRDASRTVTREVRERRARTAALEAALEDPLAHEVALLRAARHHLAAEQPDAALEPLVEHAETFPDGQLREEREALIEIASCATGAPSAQQREIDFVQRFPESSHIARVPQACSRSD